MACGVLFAALALTLSARAAAPSITVEPAAVDGETPSVVLTGRCIDDERCRFAVELGSVTPLGVVDGVMQARWTVPGGGPPRRVAAALIDSAARSVGFALLELRRTARVDIKATPYAKVRLFIGDELVSAGDADARGYLSLRVVVPPTGREARVEQTTSRKHPAPPRVDKLPVSDGLHVFAVPLEQEVTPGRDVTLMALTYRDATGATDARVDATQASGSEALSRGTTRLIVPTRIDDASRAEALAVRVSATQAGVQASTELAVPFTPLPAVRVILTAEHESLVAGTRAALAVRGVDALGRTAKTDARFVVLPPYASTRLELRDGQLFVDVPGALEERTLRIEARLEDDDRGGAVVTSSFALRPADGGHLRLLRLAGTTFEAHVTDNYGNPTDHDAPTLEAEAGRIGGLHRIQEGVWQGTWTSEEPQANREVTRIVASLPTAKARETLNLYRYREWAFETGLYGGSFVGRGDIRAFGGTLLVQARLPFLPPRLSVDGGLGVWVGSRAQTQDALRADRDISLVPNGLGASWEHPLGVAWRLDAGALVGGLFTSSRVAVRDGESQIVSPVGTSTVVPQATPWLRLARALGPGAVGLLLQGSVAADVGGLRRSPLGGSLAVGYAWDP